MKHTVQIPISATFTKQLDGTYEMTVAEIVTLPVEEIAQLLATLFEMYSEKEFEFYERSKSHGVYTRTI